MPPTKKVVSWQVTFQFSSFEEAESFIEDTSLLKDTEVVKSFKRAAKESINGAARPIEELFQKFC